MLIALIAAVCMVITDVLATIMVMAEASGRGWLAGWMDTGGWYFSIYTTSISVAAINARGPFVDKLPVLVFVGAANLFGTKLGQITGSRIVRRTSAETITSLTMRLLAAEQRLAALEAPNA